VTREEVYAGQLKALGIYEEAFEPEIKTLAQLERELTRAKKAWSATAPKGSKPSLLDPHYGIITSLRREILMHRESLGLTPKALRRLRGATAAGPDEASLITERLDLIAQRVMSYDDGRAAEGVGPYDEPVDAAEIRREWDEVEAMLK